MDNVAHNVHRSAARRYTPDGGEIFTEFLSSSFITHAVLKKTSEPSLPRTTVCPSFTYREDARARTNNLELWDVLCVLVLRRVLESLDKCLDSGT